MNVKEFSATFGDGKNALAVKYEDPAAEATSEDMIVFSPGRLTFEQAEELARVLLHLTGAS